MSKLSELLEKLQKSLTRDAAVEGEEPIPEEDATPAPEDEEAPSAPPPEVAALSAQLERAIEIIQLLDGHVRGLTETVELHSEVLETLATSETQRIKSAMEGGDWSDALFVATRSASEAEANAEGGYGGPQPIQQAPAPQVREGGTILAPVMGHQG